METTAQSGIYPESWQGWREHARVGRGVFGDPVNFCDVLTRCWEDFLYNSVFLQQIPAYPPPTLRVVFQAEALAQWSTFFDYLHEHFSPVLHGNRLVVEVVEEAAGLSSDSRPLLQHPRDFYFLLDSPLFQRLRCHFLLGQTVVNSVSLGQVALSNDQVILDIKRGLLGLRTVNSDIAQSFKQSPASIFLSDVMHDDLKYIGWTFDFQSAHNVPMIQIFDLQDTGTLQGGELLLQEGQKLRLGEPVDFYQGYEGYEAVDSLRCRFVLVPEDVRLEPPVVEGIELFLHEHPTLASILEARVHIQGEPLQDDTLLLHCERFSAPFRLQAEGTSSSGATLYRGLVEESAEFRAYEPLTLRIEGQNRFGLTFPEGEEHRCELRPTLQPQFQGQRLVRQNQLSRDWELHVTLEGFDEALHLDLNAWTLWLQPEGIEKALRLVLASVQGKQLLFRYLPRTVELQLPIKQLLQSSHLKLWLEQKETLDPIGTGRHRLSIQGNHADKPMHLLRIVDFEGEMQLLPSEQSVALSGEEEFVVEGHRLQLFPGLVRPTYDHQTELWDLLLHRPANGLRRVLLFPHSEGWMRVVIPDHKAGQSRNEWVVRSLWLSRGLAETVVDNPANRNPEGGPCAAFGLGCGMKDEMAQIRPWGSSFRLHRHRQQIPVDLNGLELSVEPYERPSGMALEAESGWIRIEQAVLFFQWTEVHGTRALELSVVGYLLQRPLTGARFHISSQRQLSPEPQVFPLTMQTQDSFSLDLHLSAFEANAWLKDLYVQEDGQSLPRRLRFGEMYEHGKLKVQFWRTEVQPWEEVAAPPTLEKTPTSLLIDIASKVGRQRFHLSSKHGRLGFWTGGSAFISTYSSSGYSLSSSEERPLEHGDILPPGSLLVGSDISQCDLLLPEFFRLPAGQLFALCSMGGPLILHPLHVPIIPLVVEKKQGGSCVLQERAPWKKSVVVPWDTEKRFLFRCGNLVMELSRNRADRNEVEDMEILFSVRGLLHELHGPFTLGGTLGETLLPLMDVSPSTNPAVFSIYPAQLTATQQGDALIGLRQAESSEDLVTSLRQKLDRAVPVHGPATSHSPLLLLRQIHQKSASTHHYVQQAPPALNQTQPLPPAFVTEGMALAWESHGLVYHFRTRKDGHPPLDRAPSWLELKPTPELCFAIDKDGHFQSTDGSRFERLFIGRPDPSNPAEQDPVLNEKQLSLAVFEEEERSLGKLLLEGYSPRRSCWLEVQEGKLIFCVPAPKRGYHVTLQGEPCRESVEIEVTEPVRFHINHLFWCEVERRQDVLMFRLPGYLVGHQQDPSWPMTVEASNRVGAVPQHHESLRPFAMKPGVLPPYFARMHAPRGPIREGALPLPDGGEVQLIDLKAWKQRPASLQPPKGNDRLLWFSYDDEQQGAYIFTPESQSEASGTARLLQQMSQDQGSSFAFGEPLEEVEEQDTVEAEVPRVLRVGWFGKMDTENSESFGFLHPTPGPQAEIGWDGTQFVVRPVEGNAAVEQLVMIERQGRLTPLHGTQPLQSRDILICGSVGFIVRALTSSRTLTLQRKWCWLPSRQKVELCGESLPRLQWPFVPIGLTGISGGSLCRVYPRQRGHLLEPLEHSLEEWLSSIRIQTVI
jgi:hypothetical protein